MNGIGYADNFNHFRRLRPQARFGAQPPKAALSAEINTIILHSAFHILHSGGTPVNDNLSDYFKNCDIYVFPLYDLAEEC